VSDGLPFRPKGLSRTFENQAVQFNNNTPFSPNTATNGRKILEICANKALNFSWARIIPGPRIPFPPKLLSATNGPGILPQRPAVESSLRSPPSESNSDPQSAQLGQPRSLLETTRQRGVRARRTTVASPPRAGGTALLVKPGTNMFRHRMRGDAHGKARSWTRITHEPFGRLAVSFPSSGFAACSPTLLLLVYSPGRSTWLRARSYPAAGDPAKATDPAGAVPTTQCEEMRFATSPEGGSSSRSCYQPPRAGCICICINREFKRGGGGAKKGVDRWLRALGTAAWPPCDAPGGYACARGRRNLC
jgi:hypothetical protein